MDIKIEAVSSSLNPNPTETGGSVNLSFDVYEYVPGEYKISVRRLCTRSGVPFTTRSGKYLLCSVKVPL